MQCLTNNMVNVISKDRCQVEDGKRAFEVGLKLLQVTHKIIEGQKITDENAERVAKFIDAREKLLDKEVELTGVLRLSRAALAKAGVKIPGIFSNLMPILTD